MKIFKNTKVSDKNIVSRVRHGEVAVCLSRHGESEGNVDFSIYKHTSNADIKMTDKGKDQVKDAAYQLCKLFHQILVFPWKIERFRIYSSPYMRAQESTSIFGNSLLQGKLFGREKAIKIGSITTTSLLAEQDYGLAEGSPSMEHFAGITHGEKELYDRLGKYLYAPPRGESLRDVYTRCGLFTERERWFESNTFNIICTHKGVCTELERYLTGTTTGEWSNAETRIYIVNPAMHQAINWGSIREKP